MKKANHTEFHKKGHSLSEDDRRWVTAQIADQMVNEAEEQAKKQREEKAYAKYFNTRLKAAPELVAPENIAPSPKTAKGEFTPVPKKEQIFQPTENDPFGLGLVSLSKKGGNKKDDKKDATLGSGGGDLGLLD